LPNPLHSEKEIRKKFLGFSEQVDLAGGSDAGRLWFKFTAVEPRTRRPLVWRNRAQLCGLMPETSEAARRRLKDYAGLVARWSKGVDLALG
jgi:hypothetical protein